MNYSSRGRRSGRPQFARPYQSNRSGTQSSRWGAHPARRSTKQRIDPARFIKQAKVSVEIEHPIKHKFSDFALDTTLASNIAKAGFTSPLPIQDQAIPVALAGKDVIGLANTGTGKTAAFLIPLIQKQLSLRHVALIMAPTRELAIQIQNDFRTLSVGLNLYSALCVGGQPIYRQRQDLKRRPQFIIGTPGRLLDLLNRGDLKLNDAKSLVLDEVDRMVDMGFIRDITKLIETMQEGRQSLFFTATIPANVQSIMQRFLKAPVQISVKTGETAANIEQNIVRLNPGENKFDKLHEIITREVTAKTLVFGETKHGVEKIHKALEERGIRSVSIHGNKSQGQRQRALLQFRSDQAQVMVATDVAARGLDIKDVSHVINYDTPNNFDDYTHRIGRAGRVGNKGYALTFVD